MTESLKATVSGVVFDRTVAVEVNSHVADRFREARLRLKITEAQLLKRICVYFDKYENDLTENDIVRFLNKLQAEGYLLGRVFKV